jgi:dihydrofolate reductase
MRKIILHFAITLDGMVSNVEQWVALNDEAINDTGIYQDTLDAIIFGKNSYQPLVEYWTNAETASGSPAERRFAKSLNDMHKYVLSHGEVDLTWKNSELLRVKDVKHSSRRSCSSRTPRVKIFGRMQARGSGGHFWNMICGTGWICWSIPWS